MSQFLPSLSRAVLAATTCVIASGQEDANIRIQVEVQGNEPILLNIEQPDQGVQLKKDPEVIEIKAKVKAAPVKIGGIPLKQRVQINAAPGRRILIDAQNPLVGSPTLTTVSKPMQELPAEPEKLDRLRLFDGSVIRGNLIEINENRLLRWANEAAAEPLSFRFSSIDSIELAPRIIQEENPLEKDGQNILLTFNNGDRIRGRLSKVDEKTFGMHTSFAGALDARRENLASVILLPPSHETLYDASEGFYGWTPSNPNAWRTEGGDLVTVVSGSIGRVLPEKDAIEIELRADWERSFYFRVQMFSDSQSRGYGSIGYDLSFANNRMNLQVAKRKKGRLTRETIGSAVINDLFRSKSGHFRIYGNRKTKEFAVWLDGKQAARWKDGDDDFAPMGNSVVFYNQGGSSSLRLKDTTISGWDGDFAPVEPPARDQASAIRVTFVNGDSTTAEIGALTEGKLFLETKRGKFPTPLERIRSIHFPERDGESAKPASERLWLTRSTSRLALNLLGIDKGFLLAESPNFGPIKISTARVRRLTCNLHLLELEKYLAELRLARRALQTRNIQAAQEILQRTNSHLRGWLWGRLAFHVQALSSSEILSFVPHPESGLAEANFAGDSETILTVGKDATFGLWNGHARLASGKIEGSENLRHELGRFPNEAQRLVTISRDFWLGEFEVKQEQYEKLTSENPSSNKNEKMPVENISWNDARAFCDLLNERFPSPPGYLYRLPTEAEWEFACRAGSDGPFAESSPTSLPSDDNAYTEHLEKLAWFSQNSDNASHPVGEKDANAYGIHDMHGNLWEWCLDHVELNKRNMLKTRIPGAVDPFFSEGRWRSLRGGSFNVSFNRCRAAYRGANSPDVKRNDRGFRVALAPDLTQETNATVHKAQKPHVLEEIGLRLMPIPAGSFLMGSPEKLPGACAVAIPKKDLIITGGANGALRLSDFAGRPPRKLGPVLPAGVTALAASPDGKLLVAGCRDGSTHLVSLPEGKPIGSFSDHAAPVVAAAFSPDGRQVASGGLDGKAFLHSSDGKGNTITLEGNSTCFDNLDFSQDGEHLLASGPGNPPTLWNTLDGSFRLPLRVKWDDVVAARFSPDGQGTAVACRSGRILFCETSYGHTYNVISLSGRELSDLRYSPDGDSLLIGTHEGLCSLRKVPQGKAIHIVDANGSLTGSPDYYFDLPRNNTSADSTPASLEAFLAKHDTKIDGDALPSGCARSPDKAWILTAIDGSLRLWRTETGKQEAILAEKLSAPFETCAFSPDGLFAAGRLESGQILAYPAIPPSGSADPNLRPETVHIRSWLTPTDPR